MVQKGRPRLPSLTAEDTSAASVHNNRRGTDGMPGWPTSADLSSPTLRPRLEAWELSQLLFLNLGVFMAVHQDYLRGMYENTSVRRGQYHLNKYHALPLQGCRWEADCELDSGRSVSLGQMQPGPSRILSRLSTLPACLPEGSGSGQSVAHAIRAPTFGLVAIRACLVGVGSWGSC